LTRIDPMKLYIRFALALAAALPLAAHAQRAYPPISQYLMPQAEDVALARTAAPRSRVVPRSSG
jgi:hypothetical protein